MKKILCLIMALAMAAALCACGKEDYSLLKGYEKSDSVPVYDYLAGEDIAPENYDKFVKGSENFAFALLSALNSENTGENTLVSPYSVSAVLSLLSNGASDSTRKELRNVLAAGLEQNIINESNYYLSGRLSAFNTEEAKFTDANSLWLNDTFDVKATFLQTAVNYYDAGIQRILFSEDDAEKKINKWISDNTDSQITDTVDNVDESERAVIVNAVLFEDEWATAYTENDISSAVFYGADADVTASFMTSTEHYISTSYAQGIVKGFKNLPLKFAALLPAEDMDINEFAAGLTGTKWQALLDSQNPSSFCTASIPEFEIKGNNDLTNPLLQMGIEKIFDADKADFSAMTNSKNVYVSSVSQDAFITIGPAGAKAGAATVVYAGNTSDGGAQYEELVFDRPFVFVIYDNESGVPVFTGVVKSVK